MTLVTPEGLRSKLSGGIREVMAYKDNGSSGRTKSVISVQKMG